MIRGIARGDNSEELAGYSFRKVYLNIPFDKLVKTKDWDSFKKPWSAQIIIVFSNLQAGKS